MTDSSNTKTTIKGILYDAIKKSGRVYGYTLWKKE